MIALIQRVTHANVIVAGNQIANIDKGILLLLGVEKEDTEENAKNLLSKVTSVWLRKNKLILPVYY